MLQQITVPMTPEETAASLSRLNREDRRYVEGVIVTLAATAPQRTGRMITTMDSAPGQAQT